jgi:hypothetical protein
MGECAQYRLLADQTIFRTCGDKTFVSTVPAGTLFELPIGFDAGPMAEIVQHDGEWPVRVAP